MKILEGYYRLMKILSSATVTLTVLHSCALIDLVETILPSVQCATCHTSKTKKHIKLSATQGNSVLDMLNDHISNRLRSQITSHMTSKQLLIRICPNHLFRTSRGVGGSGCRVDMGPLLARQQLQLLFPFPHFQRKPFLSSFPSVVVSPTVFDQNVAVEKAMSAKPRVSNSRSTPPPRFQLSSHTERANALAEKAFYGKISQKDYDAQTYSTTIVSMDRATSVPIVLTLDESLATVKVYALRKFKIPLAKAETTKMYVLWSTKVFNAVGVHSVPENLGLLDQDTLNMILTFMKASPQVEQLLLESEEDVAEVAIKSGNVTVEVDQIEAEAEDDTPVQKEEHSTSLNAKERGSLKGKEPWNSQKEEPSASPYAKVESNIKGKELSSSRKGKERESSKSDRHDRDSVKDHQRDPSLLVRGSEQRASIAKQQDTPKQVRAKIESRTSGSSSGASKGSSRDQVKEEKRGSPRAGH